MNNFENINIEPKTIEEAKAKILSGLNKESFGIIFNKNEYNFIKNSPGEVVNLCDKHNMGEQFLNICKQDLLNRI